MSANLTRLNIIDVDDSGENVGAYIKRVHIVEAVDSDGNPWEPVPGPDPFDELVVAQGVTWSESNVYAVGETISGTSATYIGGTGNETYRSRVQFKSATDTEWTNTPWTNHLNVPKVISGVIPPGYEKGEVRFKTQAADLMQDSYVPVNSIAPIKTIAPLEWGNITQTVDGNAYPAEGKAVSMNSPIICAVSFDGNVDDVTYEWSRRGTDNVLIGTPNAAQTVITFPEQGVFTITCTLKSNKTEEWSSVIFTFYASPPQSYTPYDLEVNGARRNDLTETTTTYNDFVQNGNLYTYYYLNTHQLPNETINVELLEGGGVIEHAYLSGPNAIPYAVVQYISEVGDTTVRWRVTISSDGADDFIHNMTVNLQALNEVKRFRQAETEITGGSNPSPGSTLVITDPGHYYGGTLPFTLTQQWMRRPTSGGGWSWYANGTELPITADHVGYDFRPQIKIVSMGNNYFFQNDDVYTITN